MTTRPRLTVLGTGYLGTTHAICMAELGYDVLGVDCDAGKISKLDGGEVPFYEPGLAELLTRTLASGRLRFTTSAREAAEFGEVHFLCVGTPQKVGSLAADTSYLQSIVTELAPYLDRSALVVGKSTVPVGTAQWVENTLHAMAPAGQDITLVWNPEFLREGFAVNDTLRPDRLVYGIKGETTPALLDAAYQGIYDLAAAEQRELPVIVTDFATAELAKSAANAFLATKISFINAMAELCEASGADVVQLARALGHDARIGPKFLRAGIGFGGGCLPKDVRALRARAEELGVAFGLLDEVDATNARRRTSAVTLALSLLDKPSEAKVAILGVTFKPGTDDVRDSPALDIATHLVDHCAQVSIYDPVGMDNARSALPKANYTLSPLDAVQDADLVLALTEWDEISSIDPELLAPAVKQKRVIDGRNCLDARRWRNVGWQYHGMGRH
ncbi:MAG: UDP-glucose/GDP-mannose dehydrogenase family protein [Corynebacteriales bacterium]|nr:UDP-glucose/GDP-mannose dehydrogenase family protein [Mycobacteriales bacterium]